MEFIVPNFHMLHKWSRWKYKYPESISIDFQVKECIVCHKKKQRYVS